MANKYNLKNLLANAICGIRALVEVYQYFEKYPKLQTLAFDGEGYHDEEMSYVVDFIYFNGAKYEVNEEDGEPQGPHWMFPKDIKKVYDTGHDLMVIVCDGDPMEDIEIKITRTQIITLAPILSYIDSAYKGIIK